MIISTLTSKSLMANLEYLDGISISDFLESERNMNSKLHLVDLSYLMFETGEIEDGSHVDILGIMELGICCCFGSRRNTMDNLQKK